MAPAPRTSAPSGDRSRRRGGRTPQRISVVAVLVTVLALGGAVAGVYTTGVTLGARLAPSNEDDARGTGRRSDGRPSDDTDVSSSSTAAPDGGEGSLPDRVEDGSSTSTGPTPSSTEGGGAGPGTTPGGDPPVEPYPGVWPYVSWDEVAAHAARGDGRYRTPTDTALRFASDVVGLSGASVGEVDERGVVATVEIRSGRGSTLVTLTGATAGRASSAVPWSVVEATGEVGLTVPTAVSGAAVRTTTDGRPGVVGVHDRGRWRGIGVAPTPGAPFDVRIDPGAGGPAIAVAVAGDPRAPASFTARRVNLAVGAGAPVPAAPADPLAATEALVAALDQGDVGATWELLAPPARRSVLDWRGLAGRIPALRDQLGLFASGSFTTTDVITPIGTVSVVAPAVAEATTPLAALAFRVDGGARLASTEAGSVTWRGPTTDDPGVVASGPTRPLALVVDGAVWSATPDGATGLRALSDTLAAGPHLAIAVSVQGEQVTASAFRFDVPDTPTSTPDDPPATPEAPAAADPEPPATAAGPPPTARS